MSMSNDLWLFQGTCILLFSSKYPTIEQGKLRDLDKGKVKVFSFLQVMAQRVTSISFSPFWCLKINLHINRADQFATFLREMQQNSFFYFQLQYFIEGFVVQLHNCLFWSNKCALYLYFSYYPPLPCYHHDDNGL